MDFLGLAHLGSAGGSSDARRRARTEHGRGFDDGTHSLFLSTSTNARALPRVRCINIMQPSNDVSYLLEAA
jgi:hypothetical protein